MLVLRQLIVVVRNLEPVARCKQIQMERIMSVRLIVEAVEDAFVIPLVVEGREFRGIQKVAVSTRSPQRNSPTWRLPKPKAAISLPSCRTSPLVRIHVAEHPPGAQPGARRDIRHQTGLIPKLGARRPVTASMFWIALVGVAWRRACSADR